MIKAAIFDMDGLLVDSEPLWQRVVAAAYQDLGIELTADHHRVMAGQRTLDNAKRMHRQHQWTGPTPEQLTEAIIQEMVRLIGSEVGLKPGVHHALAVCKAAGLPAAIASSSDEAVIDAVVDALEIREHFDHIYSAQFETRGKPHPDVFLSVARRFKVSPQDCLVFEDSPNGVQAAKAAGMICVAVPEPRDRTDRSVRTADVVLGSLEEFNEQLLKRLG